jgi:predicted MFS family arabinose efflux permease
VSRRHLFGTLCGLVFLINFSRIVFAPLLDVFITEFTIDEATAGLIVTILWVGSASPRLPAGWLLMRFSRTRVITVAGIGLATASLFTSTATAVPTLMIGTLGIGVASGLYVVAAGPLISALYPSRIGRYLGIHGTFALAAATVAAPVVTVALAVDWRWIFVGLATAAIVATAFLVLQARRTDRQMTTDEKTGFRVALREEWPTMLFSILVLGLVGFVWQGIANFYDLYMQTKGLPPEISRNMLTVVFGAGVPGMYVGGRVADRVPYVPLIVGLVCAFVGCLAVVILSSGLLTIVVVSLVVGFVVHMFFPALGTFLLDSVPGHSRNSVNAIHLACSMLLQSMGSAVVGYLVGRGLSYDQTFGLMAGGLSVMILVLLTLYSTDRLDHLDA